MDSEILEIDSEEDGDHIQEETLQIKIKKIYERCQVCNLKEKNYTRQLKQRLKY